MVKEGFKNSEIGLIPKGWDLISLGEICDVVGGGTPKTGIKNYWYGEINWFTPTEVGNNKYLTGSLRKISHLGLKNSSSKILPIGTVLLTTRAGIGDMGILTVEACTNQGFQSLIPKDNSISEFVYYLVSTLKNQLIQNASGSTFLEISPNKLKSILVAIPSLPEQKNIAGALSNVDNWIDSLKKIIEKKRLIKQGAMQQLLTPKEGWEDKRLGEVADIIGGGTPSTFVSNFWNGSIEWFTPTEVGKSKYLFRSGRKISQLGLKNSSATILPINSILLTSRAGIGDLGILKVEASTNQGFQSIVCKSNSNYEFIYYLIQTKKNELLSNASGSTFLEISPNKVKSLRICIPSLIEQNRIAIILSDMDIEIERLHIQLSKARKIKQGMMQELLMGRVRLV